MSSNMTVQSFNIGGNVVQPTPEGNIKVTSQSGKIQELTQDQFKNQIKKNKKNIKKGNGFEFDQNDFTKVKDYTLAKIGALVAAVTLLVVGIVKRKSIGKWFSKAADAAGDAVKGKAADAVDEIRLKVLKANGLKNEAEYTAIQKYADPKTPKMEYPENLPKWARDKETCQRYDEAIKLQMAKTTSKAAKTTAEATKAPVKPQSGVVEADRRAAEVIEKNKKTAIGNLLEGLKQNKINQEAKA